MSDTSRIEAKKTRRERQGRSQRAGLNFPVSRFHRQLRRGAFGIRTGTGAPVYLAAVVEYLTAEILECAGNCAKAHKVKRITPRHVNLAILGDDELRKLCDVTIPGGGVMPVHAKEKKAE
jgi:histone H2A